MTLEWIDESVDASYVYYIKIRDTTGRFRIDGQFGVILRDRGEEFDTFTTVRAAKQAAEMMLLLEGREPAKGEGDGEDARRA